MADDVLSKLSGAAWRGIPFPISRMRTSFAHDQALHAFMYTDGVHIEATGRGPLMFQISAPFHNGVVAAPQEGWGGQTLYPTLFGKVMAALIDRSSGIFLHPALGPIVCKAKDVDSELDPMVRDGETISFKLIQSNDDGDDITGVIARQSPVGAAQAAAGTADAQLAKIPVAALPELANNKTSFTEMLGSYFTGDAGLGPVFAKVGNLSDALDRLDAASFVQLRFANESMRASATDLQAIPTQPGQKILSFSVTRDTPVTSVASSLGVSTTSILGLNPALAKDPLVAKGTTVLYPTLAL